MKIIASKEDERDSIEPVWLWNLMCGIGAIRMWLKETATWAVIVPLALLYCLVLALTTDKNSKVEPLADYRKMAAVNAVSIVFIFALAFAGVWVTLDAAGCALLNWCH